MPAAITTYRRPGREGVTVEQLRRPEAVDLAQGFLQLILSSYAQFEGLDRPLPEGTLAADRYNPKKPEHVAQMAARIRSHIALGSQYSVIRQPRKPLKLIAFAKVTEPGVVDNPYNDRNALYLNDIMTRPDAPGVTYRHQGFGSMVMHAALGTGHDPNRPVVLEGFLDNLTFYYPGLKVIITNAFGILEF